MSKSIKAVLLSALVFPGSGHLLLRKHIMGALLAGVAATCLYLVLSTTVEIALDISAKIESGEIPLDATKITEAVSGQVVGGGAQALDAPATVFLICWLFGIIDSYRLGRSQDEIDSSGRES